MLLGYYRLAWFRPRRAQPSLLRTLSKPAAALNHYTLTAEAGSYAYGGQAAQLTSIVTGQDLFNNGSGGAPDNWTPQWDTSGVTWTEQASGVARAAVSANDQHALRWDEARTNGADIELLCEFETSAAATPVQDRLGLVLRGSGSGASETGYILKVE